jgi:uncharacterized protein (DUF433 family)
MRKLPEETVQFVLELLLSGWTPREIDDSGVVDASWASISRIAKEYGLSASRGGVRSGAGKPKGTKGGGRPTGTTTSVHRDAVLALRAAGYSWREIAEELGLKSYQHAQQLAK